LVYKRIIPKVLFRGFVARGATAFTSISSITFRAIIPRSWSTVSFLPKSVSLGGQLGRATSGVGFYVTVGQLIWGGYENFKTMPITVVHGTPKLINVTGYKDRAPLPVLSRARCRVRLRRQTTPYGVALSFFPLKFSEVDSVFIERLKKDLPSGD
jgi:hypothetical protein